MGYAHIACCCQDQSAHYIDCEILKPEEWGGSCLSSYFFVWANLRVELAIGGGTAVFEYRVEVPLTYSPLVTSCCLPGSWGGRGICTTTLITNSVPGSTCPEGMVIEFEGTAVCIRCLSAAALGTEHDAIVTTIDGQNGCVSSQVSIDPPTTSCLNLLNALQFQSAHTPKVEAAWASAIAVTTETGCLDGVTTLAIPLSEQLTSVVQFGATVISAGTITIS